MIRWLGIFLGTLRSAVRTRRELALEQSRWFQSFVVATLGHARLPYSPVWNDALGLGSPNSVTRPYHPAKGRRVPKRFARPKVAGPKLHLTPPSSAL